MLPFSTLAVLFTILSAVRAQLDPTTMATHLANGMGILGNFSTAGSLTDWMAVFDDSTAIVDMNIPGTHDTSAWNVAGIQATILQTQDFAIFDQLNAGIRFFDLRFGSNNGVLQMYHADTLLDTTATLEDVLWGFYKFLETHPTETVILSLKVDHGTSDATLQAAVQTMLTTAPVSNMWLLDAALGTLGAARGKAILFRRFEYDGTLTPFGIDVSIGWMNNVADINVDGNAWVEDLFEIDGLPGNGDVISTKFAAVQQHLQFAQAPANATDLFVTFASAGGSTQKGYATPRILAQGDANSTGVNALLLPTLSNNGSRIGIIPLDFFQSPSGLVLAIIGSSKVTPNASALPSSTGTSAGAGPTDSSHKIGSATGQHAGSAVALLAVSLALAALL